MRKVDVNRLTRSREADVPFLNFLFPRLFPFLPSLMISVFDRFERIYVHAEKVIFDIAHLLLLKMKKEIYIYIRTGENGINKKCVYCAIVQQSAIFFRDRVPASIVNIYCLKGTHEKTKYY